MKTSIRLLISEQCNRFCTKCCNQTELHDLDGLPQVDVTAVTEAKEIVLTGGEPLLDPLNLQYIIRTLRSINRDLKIYLYTAKTRPPANLVVCMEHLDGITVTLHEQKDVNDFENFQTWLNFRPEWLSTKSLRLNYFSEAGVDIQQLETVGWLVTNLKWLDECPLPENEIFMRWAPPTLREHNYRKAYNERNRLLRFNERST